MKKLEKIRIRGAYVPNCVIWLKGFIHAKHQIVSWEGESPKIIRSPYLYGRRYAYIEYREKLLRMAEELVEPLRTKSFEIMAQKNVDEEKLQVVLRKIEHIGSPSTGNECRARLALDAEKEQLVIKISEEDARRQELVEQINLLELRKEHLLEENLSVLLRKSYIYLTGAQSRCKSTNYYLKKEDYAKEVFQDLLPLHTA